MFVSGDTIGINNNSNCSSMLNVNSCARFFFMWVGEILYVLLSGWVCHVMQRW